MPSQRFKSILPIKLVLLGLFLGGPSLALEDMSSQYCLALRGNGELMPAHLGSLAQTVEVFGIPIASAGGSSASFSIFLLDSILANPVLKNLDYKTKSLYVATLIKSIEGYMTYTFNQPIWRDFFDFIDNLQNGEIVSELKKSLSTNGPTRYMNISNAIKKVKDGKIFYGPAIQKLHNKLLERNVLSVKWRQQVEQLISQAKDGLAVLGKFDAKNDKNLFLRDPILNFSAITELFDQLASFYSLTNADPILVSQMQILLDNCANRSLGKTWPELTKMNPVCQQQLNSLIETYHITKHPIQRLHQLVGSNHSVLISTGIIRGSSAESLAQAKARFDQNYLPVHGNTLKFNPDDISYGYIGSSVALKPIQIYLNNFGLNDNRIDKSKRFLNLGQKTWQEAIILSASEPGLASFIPTTTATNEKVLSTGGWSDLHPVIILKALGCPNVVYVTRKGGDTIFGQGVSKRLFGFLKPWDQLDPYEPNKSKNEVLNNNGDPSDQNSQWSKMFNLANPNSNFDYALRAADAVKCTDWNRFDIMAKGNFSEMISESYRAPIYFSPTSNLKLLNLVQPQLITSKDNSVNSRGFHEFAGCISFTSTGK